eukprot:scaffold5259_cov168-Ochromonas_danica.AAC.1
MGTTTAGTTTGAGAGGGSSATTAGTLSSHATMSSSGIGVTASVTAAGSGKGSGSVNSIGYMEGEGWQKMMRELQESLLQQQQETEEALDELKTKHHEEMSLLKKTLRRQFKKEMDYQQRERQKLIEALQEDHQQALQKLEKTYKTTQQIHHDHHSTTIIPQQLYRNDDDNSNDVNEQQKYHLLQEQVSILQQEKQHLLDRLTKGIKEYEIAQEDIQHARHALTTLREEWKKENDEESWGITSPSSPSPPLASAAAATASSPIPKTSNSPSSTPMVTPSGSSGGGGGSGGNSEEKRQRVATMLSQGSQTTTPIEREEQQQQVRISTTALEQSHWTLRLEKGQNTGLLTVDMIPANEVQAKLEQQKAKLSAKYQHKLEKQQAIYIKEKEEIMQLVRRECESLIRETQQLVQTKKEVHAQQQQLLVVLMQIDSKLSPMLGHMPSLRNSLNELRDSVQDRLRQSTESSESWKNNRSPSVTSSLDQDMEDIIRKLHQQVDEVHTLPSKQTVIMEGSTKMTTMPPFPSTEPPALPQQPLGRYSSSSSIGDPVPSTPPSTNRGSALPGHIVESRRYYATNTLTPPSSLPRSSVRHTATTTTTTTAANTTMSSSFSSAERLNASRGSASSSFSVLDASKSVFGNNKEVVFPEMLSPQATQQLLDSMSKRNNIVKK